MNKARVLCPPSKRETEKESHGRSRLYKQHSPLVRTEEHEGALGRGMRDAESYFNSDISDMGPSPTHVNTGATV